MSYLATLIIVLALSVFVSGLMFTPVALAAFLFGHRPDPTRAIVLVLWGAALIVLASYLEAVL